MKKLTILNVFLFCCTISMMIFVLYSNNQKHIETKRHIKALELDRLHFVTYKDINNRDEYISKNFDNLYTLANQLMMDEILKNGKDPTTEEITFNYIKNRYKIIKEF